MAGEMQQDGQGSVTPKKLAELLSQAGGSKVTARAIRDDVKAGAPSLPDRTIPLMPYIHWLHDNVVNGAA